MTIQVSSFLIDRTHSDVLGVEPGAVGPPLCRLRRHLCFLHYRRHRSSLGADTSNPSDPHCRSRLSGVGTDSAGALLHRLPARLHFDAGDIGGESSRPPGSGVGYPAGTRDGGQTIVGLSVIPKV